MSFSFGTNTSDDSTFTSASTWGSASTVQIVCGWWKPTTLTAGRFYWGRILSGISVAPSTSELRYTHDYSTTDGVWTTSGAGIAVDRWWFIAHLVSPGTAPNCASRFWVGDDAGNLYAPTYSQNTAPVGTATGASAFSVGNLSTSTVVAFQGQIGWVHCTNWSFPTTPPHQYLMATAGTIADDVAERIFTRHVQPMYQNGAIPPGNNVAYGAGVLEHLYCNYNIPTRFACQFTSQVWRTIPAPLGVNGATFFEERQPGHDPRVDCYMPVPRRRVHR